LETKFLFTYKTFIDRSVKFEAKVARAIYNQQWIFVRRGIVVGKYARRPLNHAARELSPRALARRIVLAAHIRAKKSNNTWTGHQRAK
jgi:hypothetical protein